MSYDAVHTEVAFVADAERLGSEHYGTAGSLSAALAVTPKAARANKDGVPAVPLTKGGAEEVHHQIILSMYLDKSVTFASAKAAAKIYANDAAHGNVAVIVAGDFEFEVLTVAASPPPIKMAVRKKQTAAKVGKGKRAKKTTKERSQAENSPSPTVVLGKARKKNKLKIAAAYANRNKQQWQANANHRYSYSDIRVAKVLGAFLGLAAAAFALIMVYKNRFEKMRLSPLLSTGPTEKSPLILVS